MNKIDSFTGEHRWLSNFWECSIQYGGFKFPTSEHAYQASKTIIMKERLKLIENCKTPGQAKRYKKNLTIREDWDAIKLNVMENILYCKFRQHSLLLTWLCETGDVELVEGNTWGDTFWGVCEGEGENNLGKILMKIRKDLCHTQALSNKEFKREERYIVIKIKNISLDERINIMEYLQAEDIETIKCVVVEQDWPEYEPVWNMLERRVTDKEFLDIPNFLRSPEQLTINKICDLQYDWVERMGWHNKTVLEALALICSEVGEAVNECRGAIPTCELRLELADIILRTADLAKVLNIDLNASIVEKMDINEKRGTRGRKI